MKPYYEHAGITIYHGDCREVLPQAHGEDSFPAFVVDPPYGISHTTQAGSYAIKGSPTWMNEEIEGDGSTELRDWIIDICCIEGLPLAMFGSPKIVRPEGARMTLIWDKGAMCGMGDVTFPWKPSFEEIYIFGDGWAGRRDEAVIKGHFVLSWESRGRTHQHEKPVSLLKHIIGKQSAATIVDPCCGTGATLIAAKQLGRYAIGIEIEEKYCEIAAKRLSQEVLQF